MVPAIRPDHLLYLVKAEIYIILIGQAGEVDDTGSQFIRRTRSSFHQTVRLTGGICSVKGNSAQCDSFFRVSCVDIYQILFPQCGIRIDGRLIKIVEKGSEAAPILCCCLAA